MTMTLQILAILSLMACGFFARRRGLLSEQGTRDMTHVLIAIVYPALIVTSILQLSAAGLARNWVMPAMATVIAITGLVLGLVAVRVLRDPSREMAGSFLFQSVFGNYLFLPLPLVLLIWGDYGVALLVFSSVAFEVILWTLGVFLLSQSVPVSERLRSLLNPSFCALLLAITLVLVRDGLGVGERMAGGGVVPAIGRAILFAAEAMGKGTVAISMLVAGSRMATLHPGAILNKKVWLVSAVRLVGVPVVMLPVLQALPMEETARGVLIVVAVMPCAVASVFFSERFGGDKDFIAGALLLTHVWAIVTVPLFLTWAL